MKGFNSSVLTLVLSLSLGLLSGVAGAQNHEEVIHYHNDALGSPVLATDANGDLLWEEAYAPYGSRLTHESREVDCSPGDCFQVETTWDEKQWFTGKYEETRLGLQYFGARWYDPQVGRFLSVDPVPFDIGNIYSFNAYAYGNNNPYKYVDPDGRAVETPWDAFNVAIGATSVVYNLSQGNYAWAALDAVGVVFDTLATIAPGVPGGAATVIQARRAGEVAVDVAKKPFALGIDDHLDDFAKKYSATTWKQFDDVENWQPQVMDKILDPNQKVLFNLDGVDVWGGVSRSASGRGGATDWELLQIRQNPQTWDTIDFIQDGTKVENPFQ